MRRIHDIECGVYQYPLPPLVERGTGGRARLIPEALPDLAALVCLLRARYEKQSRMTLRGLTGLARKQRQGQIASAQMMVRAFDDLLRVMQETVDADEYERSRQAIDPLIPSLFEESVSWPSHLG